MKKIIVELDCQEKTCGDCKSQRHEATNYHAICGVFNCNLNTEKDENDVVGDWLRCPQCLNAEEK